MSTSLPGRFDHPSWLTAAGTLVAYGLILLLLTVVLFAIPYLIFLVL